MDRITGRMLKEADKKLRVYLGTAMYTEDTENSQDNPECLQNLKNKNEGLVQNLFQTILNIM